MAENNSINATNYNGEGWDKMSDGKGEGSCTAGIFTTNYEYSRPDKAIGCNGG